MTWTIISSRHYEKQLSKTRLEGSEERQLNEWLALVPSKGPYAAALEVLGKGGCKKLHGTSVNQWQLTLGSRNRVSFTDTGFNQIELLSVGHT